MIEAKYIELMRKAAEETHFKPPYLSHSQRELEQYFWWETMRITKKDLYREFDKLRKLRMANKNLHIKNDKTGSEIGGEYDDHTGCGESKQNIQVWSDPIGTFQQLYLEPVISLSPKKCGVSE